MATFAATIFLNSKKNFEISTTIILNDSRLLPEVQTILFLLPCIFNENYSKIKSSSDCMEQSTFIFMLKLSGNLNFWLMYLKEINNSDSASKSVETLYKTVIKKHKLFKKLVILNMYTNNALLIFGKKTQHGTTLVFSRLLYKNDYIISDLHIYVHVD